MTRAKERKIRMLFMIGFAVLSTSSLAVATFAWFTSNSNAKVNLSEMKVETGMHYRLYAYNGNGYSTTPTFDAQDDFGDYFTEISAVANVNSWRPGQKVTYAIEVFDYSTENLYLYLGRYNSPSASPSRLIFGTSTNIQMVWAMNIYSDAYASVNGFVDFFAAQALVGDTGGLEDRLDIDRGTVVGANASIADPLAHASNVDGTATFFYTLEFSNDSDTFFREVDAGGATVTVPPSSGPRRFVADSVNGDSTCYGGLTFTVDQLNISTEAH